MNTERGYLIITDKELEEHPLNTIGELKDLPRDDGWGDLPTIGEAEGWSGEVW